MGSKWTWENSRGFVPYDTEAAEELEEIFQRGDTMAVLSKGTFAKSPPGEYHVYFEMSGQVNQRTGFVRAVRRNGKTVMDSKEEEADGVLTRAAKAAAAAVTAATGAFSGASASAAPSASAASCASSASASSCGPDEGPLKNVFLSTSTTDAHEVVDFGAIKLKSDKQLTQILEDNVPGVSSMLDRLQRVSVTTYIISTYHSGLPSLQGNPTVLAHSRNCLRFVFDKIPELSPRARRANLKLLAESYQSCQAEQARVIDFLFGTLSGRDQGLREQILAVVDSQKQQVLDLVINLQNPSLHTATAGSPAMQLAHLQSRYLMDIGETLTLRGIAAASLDRCAPPPLSKKQREQAVKLFRNHFSVGDVCQALVADVNHQDPDAERTIYRDTLGRWAGEAAQHGFDSHSIYYDEEKADQYEGKPAEPYQPFLRNDVALQILKHIFLKNKKR
eukprot:m.486113 g.486113  ORF g.486113 m.486113 type:complete len:447 (+) comp24184_c0_seq1:89-1429(+)